MHFCPILVLLMALFPGALIIGQSWESTNNNPSNYPYYWNAPPPPRPIHRENLLFSQCCEHEGFSDEMVKNMCKYPPCVFCARTFHRQELKANLDAWIGCFTAHQDNRMCCQKRGVRGGPHGMFDTCQDLCDGAPPHSHRPTSQYAVCRMKENAISACNKRAWARTAPGHFNGGGANQQQQHQQLMNDQNPHY